MPVVHRQRLAARLRQNWYAMYPTESTDQPPTTTTGMFQTVDDSLTSLAWLQNLNVMKLAASSNTVAARSVSVPAATPTLTLPALGENPRGGCDPTHASYRRGLSADDDDRLTRLRVDPNEVLDMTNRQERSSTTLPGGTAVAAASPWNAVVPSVTGSFRAGVFDEAASAAGQLERDRYRYDGSMKPPYSYATLICMAMQEAPDRRITLAQIYSWISDNFAFYRQADQNWQHSIRHNLSLNKCFQKVPRGKDEPGKGGFWTLNPEFNSLVDKGIFKKRRLTFSCDSSSASYSSGFGPKKDSNAAPQSPRGHRSEHGPPPSKQNYSSKENVRMSDPILDFRTDSLADVLDLHWALSQNIDVGGLSVKTEDIIDMHLPSSSSSAAAAAAMFAAAATASTGGLLLDSPPPSSDSDSELELNSLLNFSALHPPPTPSTVRHGAAAADDDDGSLDLTVHGIGLPPPDWWNGSINGRFIGDDNDAIDLPSLSSRFDDNFHPWAENRNDGINDVLMAFDAGSCLMDSENLDVVVTDGFKLL